jgi:hypothetical protein
VLSVVNYPKNARFHADWCSGTRNGRSGGFWRVADTLAREPVQK